MRTLNEVVKDGVLAILGDKGMLVRDGMTFSPIQFQYAMRVAEGFTREEAHGDARTRINMLEAQTGTGKTLGYLVPLMLYAAQTGERVMVSTFTRMLQKQILDNDAILAQRWVAKYCGRMLSVHRRVGRGNYVSSTACEELLLDLKDASAPCGEEIAFLQELIEWIEEKNADGAPLNSGVLDDFIADRGGDEVPVGIQRNRIMLKATSPMDEQAQYARDLEQSKVADVLVVNHALLVMHAYRWAQVLDDRNSENGRRTQIIVADEADRLPDAAASIIGAGLTLHGMNVLAQDVGRLYPEATTAAEAITALHDTVKKMKMPGKDVIAILPEDKKIQALVNSVVYANNAMRTVSVKLRKQLESGAGSDIPGVAKLAQFVDMANDLELFAAAMQAHDNTAVVSWSPVKEFPSLKIGRPNPGRLLSRLWLDTSSDGVGELDLGLLPEWEPIKAILFTSATLSVPGKPLPLAFDNFSISVGVSRFPRKNKDTPRHNVQVDLYAQYEPIEFGSLSFVLADPRVPNPSSSVRAEESIDDRLWESNPKWLDYAAHMIEHAWNTGGRVLVLTLSHADTLELEKRLSLRPVAASLLVHRSGETLNSLRERYMETDGAVLLTPSGWEGLDMPGMVPNLVVTRIPFAPVNSADGEILRAHLFAQGKAQDKIEEIMKARVAHAARRKLRQGIGRAIRRKTDIAKVWIADPRFPLPDSMTQSLDPIIMEAMSRKIQHLMLTCIPERFQDEAFSQAELCLCDGGLYRPT